MESVETSFLRQIFLDVIRGYSVGEVDGVKVKLKHFGIHDQSEIDLFYSKCYEDAKEKGIPTEAERLEQLDLRGFWTSESESKLASQKSFISRLEQTLSKTFHPNQKEALEKTIKEKNSETNKLEKEKIEFVGKTAEIYAGKKLNEYFIFLSMRKYSDINESYFTEDEFDNLEDFQINDLILIFNASIGKINSNEIKKIALQPFFQNYFYLTDSIYEFWGKRIIELTSFQSELSHHGKYFRSIIQNSENKIPQDILNNPDELIKFMNLTSEAQKNLSNAKGNTGAVSQPGTTKAQYEKMGMKVENPESVWARKLNRSLTNKECAEIRLNGTLNIKN